MGRPHVLPPPSAADLGGGVVEEQEQLNSTQDNYKGITRQYAISFYLSTSCLEQKTVII
jgi:hypothetical protein